MFKRWLGKSLILILVSLFAAGCGGSPSTSTGINPTPTIIPPPPDPEPIPPGPNADVFRTDEYNLSYALEAVNAAEAYALGYTGQGQIIGIVDFNFVFNSPEVDYHGASVGLNQGFVDMYEAQIGEAATTNTHGHAVAATAAGIKNDSEIHGVAFDAQILAVDFFSGVNVTQVQQGGILYHISNPWTYLMDRGVRVVSKSFGYDEGDIITNPPVVTERYTIETPAYVIDAGGLLVVSAGNNGHDDPSLSNLDLIDILAFNNLLFGVPGAFIIAGAVDENNQIASFSDRAGVAMQYYMVAPGVNVVFPWNGQLVVGSGTSFSAPIIAGAAAILFQRWPTLTAREVRQILFDTATDLGAPGVDVIYGHGLLNLSLALQPLGTAIIAVASADTGPPVPLTGMILGPVFGDALDFRSGLQNIMMLDDFQRDFRIDLSGLVTGGQNRAPLVDILEARRAWQAASLSLGGGTTLNYAVGEDLWDARNLAYLGQSAQDIGPRRDIMFELNGRLGALDLKVGTGAHLGDAIADRPLAPYGEPLLSLSQAFSNGLERSPGNYASAGLWLDGRTRLRFGASISEVAGIPFHPLEAFRQNTSVQMTALRFDRFQGTARLGAEVGVMTEEGTLLGSYSTGGLTFTDRARTTWLKLDADIPVGRNLTLAVSLIGALTDPGSTSGSLFGAIGTITTTSFALRLAGGGLIKPGDAFSLTVHQPLRVEQASATLVSGVGRDLETGDVIFGATGYSLTPSGREISLEAAYRLRLGRWTAEANLAYRLDADHIKGRRDLLGLLNFSRLF